MSAVLEGRLGDIHLLDILHLLTATAKTGRLSVARRDAVAHVDLRDGQVLDVVVPTNAVRTRANANEALVDRLTDLLAWRDGRFHFEGPPTQSPTPDTPYEDPALAEARARLRAWPRLVERLGGEQAVLRLACPEGTSPVTVSAERWRLLTLVDGHRTVAEVVAASGTGPFRVHRTLAEMLDAGLVATTAVAEVDLALIERLIHGVERL